MILFNLSGKITNISQITTGTAQNGNEWKKQEFIIATTNGQYINNYCFQVLNKALDELQSKIVPNQLVTVTFSINTNQYNNNYYTQLNAVDIQPLN